MNIKFQYNNRSLLASKYNVSRPTINKWLEQIPDINIIKGQRVFTPKQVAKIIDEFGEPPDFTSN